MKEFTPFRLDTVNQCLWRHAESLPDQRVLLTPKAFAVLRYLVEHSGRLVSQSEILDALWPDTFVQPEVLKSQLLGIRRALGDDARSPHYIETLPKRGYQFIAAVNETSAATPAPAPIARFVGRERPLEQMRECLTKAIQGDRRMMFVTGEPGLGKTALVDRFIDEAASAHPSLQFARGQCVEGYGGREAYYPMLEALGQLCRGSSGDAVGRILSAQAPSWLVQLPAFLTREHRQALQREIQGATRERMLREMEAALEGITAEAPLLLAFEDLHWVDPSTIDLISALARGRSRMRLMLIGTCRSANGASGQPWESVLQELLIHQLCQEIALEPLSESEIADYLAGDSHHEELLPGFASLVHRRTEGNPLFMTAVLDHMAERGAIARVDAGWRTLVPLERIDPSVPESLRKMIEAQIADLSAVEKQALEAASVAGAQFSPGIAAAGAEMAAGRFEECCEELSRRNLIVRRVGSLKMPDFSTAQRYEFVHALYRDVFYGRVPVGRRARLHRRIGLRLEKLYPDRASGMAAELAHHFEEGSDWSRAIRYQEMVAANARARFAHREAAAILEHALTLLIRLPEAERSVREIAILQKLAPTYDVLFDPRTAPTYEALAACAARRGLIDVQVRTLIDLALPMASISSQRYLEVLERALRLSERQEDPLARSRNRATCLVRRMAVAGWNSQDAAEARQVLESVPQACDRNVKASCCIDLGFLQSLSSEYRKGHQTANECMTLLGAQGEENAYLSVANWLSHRSLLYLGEWGRALQEIDAAIARSEKNGDLYRMNALRLHRGWVHFHAMDFQGVLQICRDVGGSFSSIGRCSCPRLCQVLAGASEAALGRHDEALEHLLTAREGMDREALLFDWCWRLALEWSLLEVWLQRGDTDQARLQGERFFEFALKSEERTWQALAWDSNARLAIADGYYSQAQQCIAEALRVMKGFEVPLAHWRVHATAASINDMLDHSPIAAGHRALSRDTILQLANSLAADSPLRATFLSSPAVTNVLELP